MQDYKNRAFVNQGICNSDGLHRIQLQRQCGQNIPYGFGLRVVGQHGVAAQQGCGDFQWQTHPSAHARVLWLSPGGIAESAGIKVGDKVNQNLGYTFMEPNSYSKCIISFLYRIMYVTSKITNVIFRSWSGTLSQCHH